MTHYERLLQMIQTPSDDCILWTGNKTPGGYGHISYKGRLQITSRLAWEAHHNLSVPQGLKVLHACDVRACVNPAHLYVGTQKQNMADMMARGRHSPVRGATNPNSKMTEADVLAIYTALEAGETAASIARRTGRPENTVYFVASGRSWRHLWEHWTGRNTVSLAHNAAPAKARVGGDNWSAKLTEPQVISIRHRYAQGESCASIARDMDLSHSIVHKAATRRTWKHLQ